MDLSIITAPVIGAAIGYVTNYIAVKMLFRPLHPVKIGKYTLPFTPGIIPKEKPRIAKGIGEIVGTKLVNHDVLEKALLSESMKTSVSETIKQKIRQISPEQSILDFTTSMVPDFQMEQMNEDVAEKLAVHIKETLLNANIGELLSQQIMKSVKEHLQVGFLAMMLNDSLLSSIGGYVSSGITDYVTNHGEELLKPYISAEIDHIGEMKVTDVLSDLKENQIYVEHIVLSGYEKLVSSGLESFLDKLDISRIVEDEINNMDVLELEKLLLTIMKKELNAIVRLGALIGFILGLINLLF